MLGYVLSGQKVKSDSILNLLLVQGPNRSPSESSRLDEETTPENDLRTNFAPAPEPPGLC